jgi:hypothetical protein
VERVLAEVIQMASVIEAKEALDPREALVVIIVVVAEVDLIQEGVEVAAVAEGVSQSISNTLGLLTKPAK